MSSVAAALLPGQKKPGTYVVVVDGVWRQADVLDVPSQLRQHLQEPKKKENKKSRWLEEEGSVMADAAGIPAPTFSVSSVMRCLASLCRSRSML